MWKNVWKWVQRASWLAAISAGLGSLFKICKWIYGVLDDANMPFPSFSIETILLLVAFIGFGGILLVGWIIEKNRQSKLLNILKVIPPSSSQAVNTKYKFKMRIVLRNVSNRTLCIRLNDFAEAAIVLYKPKGLRFQAEESEGSWHTNRWENVALEKIYVMKDEVFSAWVGLARYYEKSEIDRLHKAKQIGSLVLLIDRDEKARAFLV